MDDIYERFDRLLERVHRLEQRNATGMLPGKIVQRDHEKGVRVQLGGTGDGSSGGDSSGGDSGSSGGSGGSGGDNQFLSPWIQPGDWSGTSRYLPDIGEQCWVNAHGGDWRQATIHPYTHTDEKKNPASSADEQVVFNKGKFKLAYNTKDNTVTMTNDKSSTVWSADKITHTVDGVTHEQTKDGITRKVGSVTEKLTSSGVDTSGGKLTHEQKNIGSDHVHSGVQMGGAKTQGPDA